MTLVIFAGTAAVEVCQVELRTPGGDIPLYIAKPDGPGPLPPVLFIHAKRGIDEAKSTTSANWPGRGILR